MAWFLGGMDGCSPHLALPSKWGHLPLLGLCPFKMQGQIPFLVPKEHGLGGIGENMSTGLFEPFTFFSC